MENAAMSKRKEFIIVPPPKDLLLEYFDILNENGMLYLTFITNGTSSALCYEQDENKVFTYKAFLDRDEAEMYANYIAHKNKFPLSAVKTSAMGCKELIDFMNSLKDNNPDKYMTMSACTILQNKISAIDILWTNYKNYMV